MARIHEIAQMEEVRRWRFCALFRRQFASRDSLIGDVARVVKRAGTRMAQGASDYLRTRKTGLRSRNQKPLEYDMTKLTTYAALLVLGLSGAAFAMSDNAVAADTDGNGVLTIDEVQAVYPDVSSDGFSAMDTNADGALDADEITAAEESGLMPAPNEG